MDSFEESYVEGVKLPKHYLVPKNRYQNVLTSAMSELSGKKVRISRDANGIKVRYKEGGYDSEKEANDAFLRGKKDLVYKVEFL